MKTFLRIVFFRILKKSFVFRYWYKRHITELLFDLERCDIPGERDYAAQKYKTRLDNFLSNNKEGK